MLDLKAHLAKLDGSSKIELVSGRKPRLISIDEAIELTDGPLSDSEVIALCKSVGGGHELDELSDRPSRFACKGLRFPVEARVGLRGRAVTATFVRTGGVLIEQAPSSRREGRFSGREDRRTSLQNFRSAREDSRAERQSKRPTTRTDSTVPPQASGRAPTERDQAAHRAAPASKPTDPRSDPRAQEALLERLDQERKVQERKDRERLDQERKDQERKDQERKDRERLDQERKDRERLDQERKDQERKDRERLDQERKDQERKDQERKDQERKDQERKDRERLDQERKDQERKDREREQQRRQREQPERQEAPAAKRQGPEERPRVAAAQRPDELLMGLLQEAAGKGASDIHITAGAAPNLRLAGQMTLSTQAPWLRADLERSIQSILPPRIQAEYERAGGACFGLSVGSARVRVNATQTFAGPKISVRIHHKRPPSLDALGLPREVEAAINQPQGLVLVTGPSGHGKTTTMVALLDHINQKKPLHIITVEDPVEIPVPSKASIVSQREVGDHTKSFHRALEGALRQDPDVIAVGELRDRETTRMALSASETGHLVIATMNAPSAARAIERVLDMFPPAEQPQVRATLAGGLRLIVSQRLLPLADGRGRTAALEILPGCVPVWNLIREEKTHQLPGLMQRGRSLGIVQLEDSISALLEAKTIDETEGRRVLSALGARHELQQPANKPAWTPPLAEEPDEDGALGALWQKAGAIFGRKGGS